MKHYVRGMGRYATPGEGDRDTFAPLPTPWRAPEETEPLQPTNGWVQSAPAGIGMASSLDLNGWIAVAPTGGGVALELPSEANSKSSSSGDDYGSTTATTGTVSVGSSSTGSIETVGDTDWFRITLTAGATYQFDLQGSDSGQGTLPDPFLRLRDSSGNSITSDDDLGTGLNARISGFTATTSGTYYLSAGSATPSGTGTYRVSATQTAAPPPTDDYTSTTSTTGTISVGGTATGNIETVNDTDWFKITLTAGKTYQFDLEGSGTAFGTLVDPYMSLRDSTGNTKVAESDNGGIGLNSRFTYTATTTGTFFVAAGAGFNPNGTGTYRAKVTEIAPADDYASTTSTTGTISVGGRATGNIETAGDTDWFKITLSAGETYQFDLEGSPPLPGMLSDPFLRLRDSSGNSITSDDDGGSGLNSRISGFTATTAGTYYLSVGSSTTSGTGTYLIRATNVSTTTNAAPVVSGQLSVTFSTGQIVAATQLFTSATDSDGSVSFIRFWDTTPGAGYLAYDGARISGSYIDVEPSQLSRLTYVTGNVAGTNDLVIEAFDNQGRDSNDFQVRINLTNAGVNIAPIIAGPSYVNAISGQTLTGSQLFTSATDSGGSVSFIRFWDTTPGAGYLAYDGARISGSHIDVAPGQLARLTYVTGNVAGTNDLVIEAFDNQGRDSNDLQVRVSVAASGGNLAPSVRGPASVAFGTNQVISATQLFSDYSDSDGSVARIRFWDSTEGAGYFALDGQRITSNYVDVATSQISRLTYVTGPSAGSNDILVEVYDNQGRDSADLQVRINVTGDPTGPRPIGANAVIPYDDLTPNGATPDEIVQIARMYIGAAWGKENCTGFVWLVADQAGERFFDHNGHYTDATQSHVIDAGIQTVYVVPGNGSGDVFWDHWSLVSNSPNWFGVVQPGDLVRIHMAGYGGVHSFVVTQVTNSGGARHVWVVDNTTPDTGTIREYEMDGSTGFRQAVMNATSAWVHRLDPEAASNLEDAVASSWTVGSEVRELTGASGIDAIQIRAPITSASSFVFGSDGSGRVLLTDDRTGAALLTVDDYEELSIEGGAGADIVRIGSLTGTDIANSTIYFYGGDGADQLDGGVTDRRVVVSGGDGSDTIIGGSAADDLSGDSGNDHLDGGAGNDLIYGGAGDDILIGGRGSDVMDGGSGTDVLMLEGGVRGYTVLRTAEGFSVRGGSETDRISNVERVSFDGGATSISLAEFETQSFNPFGYLASYADLRVAFGADAEAARQHFELYGRAEGRDPGAFDAWLYAASNVDLARAFGSDSFAAAEHYVRYGLAEGRTITGFDALRYGASHNDLIGAFGADSELLLRHYLNHGADEGRSTTAFDALQYVASYSDLIGAFGTNEAAATWHFITNGFSEGRARDAFDAAQYVASYNDLIGAFGTNEAAATAHFIQYGFSEGRSRDTFDALQYVASYSDLIGAFGNDQAAATRHFITNGFSEGRSRDAFDAAQYLSNYGDLRAVFGTDQAAATLHFIQYGYFEGRTDHAPGSSAPATGPGEAKDADAFAIFATAGGLTHEGGSTLAGGGLGDDPFVDWFTGRDDVPPGILDSPGPGSERNPHEIYVPWGTSENVLMAWDRGWLMA
ncbi:MAG: pre-peptidase C-terminal domain-containing protein [Caulobacter sp.]|nr:pre-peptidase C-terminal domain-containing protein [Caulobacter sp.]